MWICCLLSHSLFRTWDRLKFMCFVTCRHVMMLFKCGFFFYSISRQPFAAANVSWYGNMFLCAPEM